jgi:cephalosporin-C deacetylase
MIPTDLETFWKRTMARTAAEPLVADVAAVDAKAIHHVHRVTYRSLGGVKVRAHVSTLLAEGTHRQRLPAIITTPGYSGWGPGITLGECQRGYVILHVYPRGQGESGELWKVDPGAFQAWVNHGKHNPEGFYYQGAYMDVVRGIDYLLTRSDVDPQRIGLMSGSQGGLLSLAVGAIDARVRAVVANEPFLCNFRHNPAHRSCPDLVNDPVFLDTFDYFEPVNLAPWLKAPTLVSSGGKDTTCPPEVIRAVWDRLPGIKALYHEPEMTHSLTHEFYKMGWEWMDRYL